jgi:ribose 5-phosphate isomerase B
VDYPDFAAAVARGVSEGRFERGVLVCGSGIGMAITANKVSGVRAAAIGDTTAARLSREHNDLNVLALGARSTPTPLAVDILRIFLQTPFEGGRHERRLEKIHQTEGR